ncbi:cyclic nucleotide-binding domain-containing protein, partial [bacterium]|nr:cyclic nucleotide-binding domain-containing protein [bacterium]
FKREGIEIPFPIRNVYMRQAHDPKSPEAITVKVRKLEQVDFLAPLTEEERQTLAREMYETIYTRGETILKQGAGNDKLYLIDSGRVRIEYRPPSGGAKLLAELGPLDFFGEHTLLTGEPVSATVCALEDTELSVLSRESFQHFLKPNPAIVDQISRILAERTAQRAKVFETDAAEMEKRKTEKDLSAETERIKAGLRTRILKFFGLG